MNFTTVNQGKKLMRKQEHAKVIGEVYGIKYGIKRKCFLLFAEEGWYKRVERMGDKTKPLREAESNLFHPS